MNIRIPEKNPPVCLLMRSMTPKMATIMAP